MDDLDDFLKGSSEEVAEQPEVVETPEPEAEEPKGPERDDKGRFAPKGEKEPEAPEPSASPAPKSEEPPLEHPALLGERKRRQAAEAKIAEYEARLAQMQQPAPQPLPSVFEDEDAYTQQIKALAVQEAMQQIAPQLAQQQKALLIEMKRENYRAKYEDFTELETELFAELEANPALAQQLTSADDPVEFGYRYIKNKREVAQLGSLDLAAIEANIRAKLEAEYAAKQPAPGPSIPNSLADAQSARASALTPQAPPTLDSILGR